MAKATPASSASPAPTSDAATPASAKGFPAKVGTFNVTLDEALRDLKFRLVLQPTVHKIGAQHLIRSLAEKEGVTVSTPELQKGLDEYRAELGLHKAADFKEYVATIGLTVDDVEWMIETNLIGKKLKEKLFGAKVQAYFVENQMDFEEIEIRHLVVAQEKVAKELLAQMKEDRVPFAKLAKEHSLDKSTRRNGGYVGWVRRHQAQAEIERVTFGAKIGEVKGPFKVLAGFELIEILDKQAPTQVNDDVRGEVLEMLFAKEVIMKHLPPT